MKYGSEGGAMRDAKEGNGQQRNSPNAQARDPREKQWGTMNGRGFEQMMSHAPKRDMSGKRKDVND